jgi:hypothetical protein
LVYRPNENKTYEAEPLPISFTHDQYVGDKLDYVAHSKTESRWEIKDFMDFIKNQNLQLVCKMDRQFILSNKKNQIPVDKDAIIKNKVVSPQYYDSIVPL